MNQFLLILLFLVVCGVIYMQKQQPEEWNKFVDSLMVPGATGPAGAPPAVATVPEQTTDASGTAQTNAVHNPNAPIYISPSSTEYKHSSHIVDVAQPSQASAKVYVPPNPLPAQPNWVWTTSDGRTYRNVVIEKAEADQVTIYHAEGTAVVDINLLPSDIETQLNYDPTLAAAAHVAREESANEASQNAAAPLPTSSAPKQ